ncbi:MAG TPA: GNAT family N-acetyltransferase [Gemmataceae bacterium]|jgi:ribosomal protein S18 acetylase RimI-like enzyme
MSTMEDVFDRSLLVPLKWDSEHFGFPVARLETVSDARLAFELLRQARRRNIVLVYGQLDAAKEFPGDLLAEFAGRLVDWKVTYHSAFARPAGMDRVSVPRGVCIREYTARTTCSQLRSLAIAASEYSRFRTDPSFPLDKLISMYTTWIARSVQRQAADTVLVAQSEATGELLGMVTIAIQAGTGIIGLLSVAVAARGQRIGSALIAAAHTWLAERELNQCRVTTQQDNVPACRLYESCGYTCQEVVQVYHFWPQGTESRAHLRRSLAS